MSEKIKRQAFNPYLPSYEYIPDGEPHVFGERVYIYGSHDRFNGKEFCMNNYVCYSAPVTDLTDWRFEGIIYRRDQDPRNRDGSHYLWAPDVVKGLDGRYYLYYCLDDKASAQIGVAVCDTPAGTYEFLDFVRDKNGNILGTREEDCLQFDPGVFIDDDGTIYLYSGNGPRVSREKKGKKGSQVMKLETDMVTVKEEPKRLLPTLLEGKGTGFEGHEFFEASSIRKWKDIYYFVYSSVNLHELCYAVSKKPDEGYTYGGVLISNCDVFPGMDIKEAKNYYGNNHGSLERINGKWYIFYHRQTNRSNFSRQGCAEEIVMREDGSFEQAKLTSCGLNGGPLKGSGTYEARIACHLRSAKGACISHVLAMGKRHPYLTQDGIDRENDPGQYIANMKNGSVAGYRYFDIRGLKSIWILVRGSGQGVMQVSAGDDGKILGEITVKPSANWKAYEGKMQIPDGVTALYFTFAGKGSLDFKKFGLLTKKGEKRAVVQKPRDRSAEKATYDSIKPGQVWKDTNGKPIQAHGFSVFYKGGIYYWYGENKERTKGGPFNTVWHWGVRCYTSKDLYNWEDRGLIIPPQPDDLQSPLHPTYCMDRPHIIYCEKTKKYVAWLKIMADEVSQFMSVMQADDFLGPYEFVHKVYKPLDMDTGDFALHVDEETKKAYFFYERPHFELVCATLSDDYTEVDGEYSEHYKGLLPPYTREAPTYFERNGKKYLFTSGTSGYYPNPSTVCMFDEYHGEYIDLGDPHIGDESHTSFSSQITCVLKVPDRNLYIACADRWVPGQMAVKMSAQVIEGMKKHFKDYKPDYEPKKAGPLPGKEQRHMENTSKSTYVWLPIEWEGEKPVIRWRDEWRVEDF